VISDSDMPNQTGRVTHKSTLLIRELPDRTTLQRKIAEILEGLPENPTLARRIERSLEAFLHSLHLNDVALTARHVTALLSIDVDDLRKAALLSLLVRVAGKRKFDPIASYILQNQKVVVTSSG
jgi:hypothetical protein